MDGHDLSTTIGRATGSAGFGLFFVLINTLTFSNNL